MFIIFVAVFFFSLFVCLLIIKYQGKSEKYLCDTDLDSVQKFHTKPVPRIGGLGIFCGFCLTITLAAFWWQAYHIFYLLIATLPAFIAGFAEDLTKKIRPLPRLIATFLAAILGFWLLKAGLVRLGISSIDSALRYYWFLSLILTVFAVGGVSHAINIIDGYNGLASMVTMMIFIALAYISSKVGDHLLSSVALGMVAAVAGFFLLNYPRGLIFLGDGGAYLLGFLVAELSVLLVTLHPSVSPWFPLLLLIYPVIETLFSIYRRKVIKKTAVSMPDALHLHTLIYRRVVTWAIDEDQFFDRNSLTSPYLWLLSSLSVIPACIFWNNTPALIILIVLFVFTYLLLYTWLIKFRIPAWLKIFKK